MLEIDGGKAVSSSFLSFIRRKYIQGILTCSAKSLFMWNERDGVSPAKVSDEALGLCGVDVACAVDQWNGADIWSRHLLLSGGRHDTVSHSVNMPVILHQATLGSGLINFEDSIRRRSVIHSGWRWP